MSDTLEIAAFTALCSALTGGIGFLASYVLTGWREDRTRRLELIIEHSSQQISEFYAPLVALTDQLNSTANVKEALHLGAADPDQLKVQLLFYDEFFLPIHLQIDDILKTKVHLLEGYETPPSFAAYFDHFASERAYWNLMAKGIELSGVQIPEYPSQFYWDVREGFEAVTHRYESSLQELRHQLTHLTKATS